MKPTGEIKSEFPFHEKRKEKSVNFRVGFTQRQDALSKSREPVKIAAGRDLKTKTDGRSTDVNGNRGTLFSPPDYQ